MGGDSLQGRGGPHPDHLHAALRDGQLATPQDDRPEARPPRRPRQPRPGDGLAVGPTHHVGASLGVIGFFPRVGCLHSKVAGLSKAYTCRSPFRERN